MKLPKLFTLFVLVSLFAAGTISCGDPAGPDPDPNEVVDPSKPDTPDTPDNPDDPVTKDEYLVATAYAPVIESSTKAILVDETNVSWQTGDAIKVYYGTSLLDKFVSQWDEGVNESEVVTFRSENIISTALTSGSGIYWALYPYQEGQTHSEADYAVMTIPAEQTAVAGSFDPAAMLSVAKSSNLIFRFYNVCGGFRFSVSGSGITSATLAGKNRETLAGEVKVSFDADGKPVATPVDGKEATSVTLTCKDGFETGIWYYIPVLPCTLDDGFTLTLTNATGIATYSYDAALTIKRNAFVSHEEVDNDQDQPGGDNKINGYEFVDLGLSVKWATCNVGAENPEDYGNYYAWGETEATTYTSWPAYKWGNGSQKSLTKYCTLSTYGKKDSLGTLELEDDAAGVNCGGTWRMPTSTELKELMSNKNCDWTWTTVNNVYGHLVTSKISGYTDKSIFLPAAGYIDGYRTEKAGQCGCYWSSSLHLAEPIFAYFVSFDKYYPGFSSVERYTGCSVRPVTE